MADRVLPAASGKVLLAEDLAIIWTFFSFPVSEISRGCVFGIVFRCLHLRSCLFSGEGGGDHKGPGGTSGLGDVVVAGNAFE